MVTLDQVLELASQLSDEQQEMLSEIVGKRLHEERRRQIAKDCHEALTEFESGGLKTMNAGQVMAELEIYLNSLESE
jgi:dihydroxyacetone kinase-like predicted kinase